MRLIVETQETRQIAILIQSEHSDFTLLLEKEIQKYAIDLRLVEQIPENFTGISYIFACKSSYTRSDFSRLLSDRHTHVLFIAPTRHLFKSLVAFIETAPTKNVKVIHVDPNEKNNEVIERALWFMLSKTEEKNLDLVRTLRPIESHEKKQKSRFSPKLTRIRIFLAVVFIILALHTLFLLPLAAASWYTYSAGKALQRFDGIRTKIYVEKAERAMHYTHATYALAEPGLRFLFISFIPANFIAIHDETITFIKTSISATESSKNLFGLILNPTKNPADIDQARALTHSLQMQIVTLQQTAQEISDRIDYKNSTAQKYHLLFEKAAQQLNTANKMSGHLNYFLADGTERDFILYFYNNMELRPGGGFIGSFAHITFENFSLKNFAVYDVYDADGQLKTHVRPPQPIRDILKQPHWFLRDSNFNPDFEENVKTADFFLEKELNITDFDGSAAMTTTALTYIIRSFGDVYVPDLDQSISADNFYLEAQTESDTNFFPGSQKKKSFLSSVAKTLMLNLEDASPIKLAAGLRQALDEKHIVIQVKDQKVQSSIESLGWSGKILSPQCVKTGSPCVVNHILPVEANLGVNKANFFVSKLMKLKTEIAQDGHITNEFSVAFTNNSSPQVFPGGPYVNYFQVYLPVTAQIKNVDINGTLIHSYDVSRTGVFKIVGLLVTTAPQETRIVTISYDLHETLLPGKNVYQIVLQKQIGSFNSDFSLEINYPDNVLLTEQNFKSVAKNHSVLYNSNLSTNKVFVTEFVKQ